MKREDWKYLLNDRIKPFLYKLFMYVGFVSLIFFLVVGAWNFAIVAVIQMLVTNAVKQKEDPYGIWD